VVLIIFFANLAGQTENISTPIKITAENMRWGAWHSQSDRVICFIPPTSVALIVALQPLSTIIVITTNL
jgi:hypothetical protein